MTALKKWVSAEVIYGNEMKRHVFCTITSTEKTYVFIYNDHNIDNVNIF